MGGRDGLMEEIWFWAICSDCIRGAARVSSWSRLRLSAELCQARLPYVHSPQGRVADCWSSTLASLISCASGPRSTSRSSIEPDSHRGILPSAVIELSVKLRVSYVPWCDAKFSIAGICSPARSGQLVLVVGCTLHPGELSLPLSSNSLSFNGFKCFKTYLVSSVSV